MSCSGATFMWDFLEIIGQILCAILDALDFLQFMELFTRWWRWWASVAITTVVASSAYGVISNHKTGLWISIAIELTGIVSGIVWQTSRHK